MIPETCGVLVRQVWLVRDSAARLYKVMSDLGRVPSTTQPRGSMVTGSAGVQPLALRIIVVE